MTRSVFVALLLILLSHGCATVAPYQRERLAQRDMTDAASGELRVGEAHTDAYREGAHGGLDTTIGGCGCN